MPKFISPYIRTTEKDLTTFQLNEKIRKRLSGTSVLGEGISQIPQIPQIPWILSNNIWNDNGIWFDNQQWND